MKRDNKIKVCRILAVVFLCFWTISGVRVLAQNATSILDKLLLLMKILTA